MITAGTATAKAQIQFQEDAIRAQVWNQGQSHGSSWGDLNGDGWPDLWVSNHAAPPSLYLNLQIARFFDVSTYLLTTTTKGDMHGAAWGDFDKDGDQDLIEAAGSKQGAGVGPNNLWVQQSFMLTDRAATFGVDDPTARGRSMLWLDWNQDSFLDVLSVTFPRSDGLAPTALFLQQGGVFQDLRASAQFAGAGSQLYAQLADLTDDGKQDLILHGRSFPAGIYELGPLPLVDHFPTMSLPKVQKVRDSVCADFDNDGDIDLFLATYDSPSEITTISPKEVHATLQSQGNEHGLNVQTTGLLYLDAKPPSRVPTSDILIGIWGFRPPQVPIILNPLYFQVQGIFKHTPGVDQGLYAGFDRSAVTWTLLSSSPAWNEVNLILKSDVPFQNVQPIGFTNPVPPSNVFLVHQGQGNFQDQTAVAGLDGPFNTVSVVAGDFDNDMDQDLYLVNTTGTQNAPNQLFENLGGGQFVEVVGAGGAAGTTLGRGESVTVADYDRDGFLDLFVANGLEALPFNNGPHELFRNVGNGNHWLEIDLIGTTSNREGIGARVLVTAGGVTQLREQNGGYHCFSQNHSRLHFGLASHTVVDQVQVLWPSGKTQTLNNVTADQILAIVEP